MDAIEKEIQENGLTAPRITPSDIEANIASEHYFTAANGVRHEFSDSPVDPYSKVDIKALDHLALLTFCVLILKNGYTVTGESACVSPENFNVGIGRKVARENAINKMWPLMGYALKEDLYRASIPPDLSNQVLIGLTEMQSINEGITD